MTDHPEITDYDRDVAKQAYIIWTPGDVTTACAIASALARTGWTPVDPDLIEARKLAKKLWPNYACIYGESDESNHNIRTLLAAIKRGRELEHGE